MPRLSKLALSRAEPVSGMEEIRNAYKICVENPNEEEYFLNTVLTLWIP